MPWWTERPQRTVLSECVETKTVTDCKRVTGHSQDSPGKQPLPEALSMLKNSTPEALAYAFPQIGVIMPSGGLDASRAALRHNTDVSKAICIDPEIMHGLPVFRGTRVPVQTLFEYLEGGDTLEDFLEGFPTVPRTVGFGGP